MRWYKVIQRNRRVGNISLCEVGSVKRWINQILVFKTALVKVRQASNTGLLKTDVGAACQLLPVRQFFNSLLHHPDLSLSKVESPGLKLDVNVTAECILDGMATWLWAPGN